MKLVFSALLLATMANSLASADVQPQQQRIETVAARRNISDEMQQIHKSIEDLLGELAIIKREASGRLSNVKNRASTTELERIRQTKVSRFVLRRVAELEEESVKMRDELSKLFEMSKFPSLYAHPGELRQEDHDFEEPTTIAPSSTAQTPHKQTGTPAPTTTTAKPDEGAQIGFDMDALKKLGLELESEFEARQKQNPESLRGVHEQVIKLVDNMVQTYLGNVRRMVQRMTNLIDNTRSNVAGSQPRQSPASDAVSFDNLRQSIFDRMDALTKTMQDFSTEWIHVVGKQQSPLIDRIPPRGYELWRDFWDTVRDQVRRINDDFWRMSRDLGRLVTGRVPRGPSGSADLSPQRQPRNLPPYSSASESSIAESSMKDFYEKMGATLKAEQQRLDSLTADAQGKNDQNSLNLIDELDDESTKEELKRNVVLRQQIQQEINVFSSIFDIMRTFIARLRESAAGMVRDVMRPGSINNDNNAVTPGAGIRPTVDQLLEDTINSQRQINSQSKPVLLPNDRQPSRY